MKQTFSKLPMFAYRLTVLTVACFLLSWLAASAAGINKVHAYPESLFKTYGAVKFATGKVVATRKLSDKGVEELLIETSSTDVRLERGEAGFVELDLQGNYPALQDPLAIETEGGRISVRTHEAGTNGHGFRFNINFDGAEGGLRMKVPPGVKRVVVKTLSGDMTFDGLDLITLAVKSTTGDLDLLRSKVNTLAYKSTSGGLRLEGTEVKKLQAETVSGDLHLALENGDPKMEASTVSGDIELTLRDKPSLKGEFTTLSGELDLDVAGATKEIRGGGTSFSVGDAKGAIFAKTTSGDLKVHQR